jgi:hypothetical protein
VYYGVFFKGKKTPEISAKVAIFWVKKMSEVTWYSNKNFFREGHSKNETQSQKLSTLLFEFSPNLAHSSSGWFANPPTWQIWRNKGDVMSVVTLLWPCQFTFKSILVQKNNHGNSNISPCQNIIFKKKKKKKSPLQQIKFLQVIKVNHKVRQRRHPKPLFGHIRYKISKNRKKKESTLSFKGAWNSV